MEELVYRVEDVPCPCEECIVFAMCRMRPPEEDVFGLKVTISCRRLYEYITNENSTIINNRLSRTIDLFNVHDNLRLFIVNSTDSEEVSTWIRTKKHYPVLSV